MRLSLKFQGSGREYIFDEKDGVDQGKFIGELGFDQTCTLTTLPGVPFRVYFRHNVAPRPSNLPPGASPPSLDPGDVRDQVIAETGKIRDKSVPAGPIYDPYTITIWKNGQQVHQVSRSKFWWFSRYPWFSSLPRILRDPAAEIKANRFPPISKNTWVKTVTDSTAANRVPFTGPMDLCGEMFDGSTGGRREIYDITEQQADYILNRTAMALSQVFDDGFANSSSPLHYRDETTGAPWNVQANPYWSTDLASVKPDHLIDKGPHPTLLDGSNDNTYHVPETAHTPDNLWVLWRLTGDPYYLEELQFTSLLGQTFSAYYNHQWQKPGACGYEQDRALAWSLRFQVRCAHASPVSPPKWLLPKSVFEQNLEDNFQILSNYLTSPARLHTVFNSMCRAGGYAVWQVSFESRMFAHIVNLGYSKWKTIHDWNLKSLVAIMDGKSGWNPQCPGQYHWEQVSDGSRYSYVGPSSTAMGKTPAQIAAIDAVTLSGYGEAWAKYKTDMGFTDAGWLPGRIYDHEQGPDYPLNLRAAYVMAIRLGHTEVQPLLDALDSGMKKGVLNFDGTFNYDPTKTGMNCKLAFDVAA